MRGRLLPGERILNNGAQYVISGLEKRAFIRLCVYDVKDFNFVSMRPKFVH